MKKILLFILFIGSISANAQSTIFEENWDGVGPGIAGWTLYNVDNRIPDADALSSLVTNAWNVLSLAQVQGRIGGAGRG